MPRVHEQQHANGLIDRSGEVGVRQAIEFARRAVFPDERPSGPELEQAIAQAKG